MLIHSCRDAFWRAFRKKSHRLIHIGYEAALPEIRQHAPEEDISGIIAEYSEKIWAAGLCFEPGYEMIQIRNEKPVDDGKRFGKDRFKIDIVVQEPRRGRPCAVFAFEAKRLRTGGHPIGEYVGTKGMGCFLKGDYASDMPEAGMIGYVQNRDMAYWKKQLSHKLQQPLTATRIIRELPHEWVTTHQRTTGADIRICHVFLDCRPPKLSD